MFSNFGFGEVAVLAFAAMLIFGPEKLPKAAMDAARVIKKLRSMADVAVNDFKSELPPDLADLDLRSLNARKIVTDALFAADRPARDTTDIPDDASPVSAVDTTPAGPPRQPRA